MVLGKAVYDARGRMLLDAGTELTEDHIGKLVIYGVGEVLLEDPRVDDVIVKPTINPELEAQASQTLRQLITEAQMNKKIEPMLIEEAKRPVYAMAKALYPVSIGEPNAGGCFSLQDYNYVQPAKVAATSLIIGRKLGISMMKLAPLGIAALLMNIGYIMMPPGILEKQGSLTEEEHWECKKHPHHSASMVNETGKLGSDVIVPILQHHERWDGSGYPSGLKGNEVSLFARIIGIVDTYYAMVSERPYRKELLPHEAMDFIIDCAGELFDPELVKIFSEEVPIYPNGITVKLSTNEVGIVSDSNIGTVGRPTVRIIYDENTEPVKDPYDIDLRYSGYNDTLITEVLGY